MLPTVVETGRGPVEFALWGEGPDVLALHGAMGGYDQGLLLAQAAIGTPQFRCIAPSRPGYLGTPFGADRTPEAQADLCAALLDTLGVETAAVIAISGGGQCALQFALRHSRRCRVLVMISACSTPLTAPVPFRFQIVKFMFRIPWLAEQLRKKAARDPDAAARRSIPDPVVRARTLADHDAGPLMRALQESTTQRVPERLPGTENDIFQSHQPFSYPLEQLSMPVLVVHGSDDEAVPVGDAKSLAARATDGELLLFEGGRHTSLFTHIHEIRSRVVPFLNTQTVIQFDS